MTDLPTALYSADQTRQLDALAMKQPGVSGTDLMESAGAYAFRVMRFQWPRAQAITVVCGPGNNGGDGYVLTRLAHEAGLQAIAMYINDPSTLKGDAGTAYQAFLSAGGKAIAFDVKILAQSEIIVDALFGTGLARALEDAWLKVVNAINQSGAAILSLDIPSGLDADSGFAPGAVIKASVTVSFVGLNTGLFTGAGPDYAGHLFFSNLEIPDAVYDKLAPIARRLSPSALASELPPCNKTLHKRQRGQVLVVGGAPGMAGAAQMAGVAAYRAGAGLVKLLTHPDHAPHLNQYPELMVSGISDRKQLLEGCKRSDVLALGPGLGQDRWAQDLFSAALEIDLPMVVDADGLNLLATNSVKKNNWILTPHPGEAATLLGVSSQAIQQDRLAAARSIADKYGGVCVLKGTGTLIAVDDDALVTLCDRGNPGMATGGTGDILTGAIVGLVAQGLPLTYAAQLGVWIHASAGDSVARRMGERGLMATDLLAELPRQIQMLAERNEA